jgi:hypothetical protein
MENPHLKLYSELKRLDLVGRGITEVIAILQDRNDTFGLEYMCGKKDRNNKAIAEIYAKLSGKTPA